MKRPDKHTLFFLFALLCLTGIAIQCDNIERNLTPIEVKLDSVDHKLSLIEKKLGIDETVNR